MRNKKIIIDSDAKNEIDDQYAITYAVLSGNFAIRGFTAAHFGKKGSMEKSYDEINHVLKLLGKDNEYPVSRGAANALVDYSAPVDSAACRFIIDEALKSDEKELHVISIGPLTNLASAFLIEPGIKKKIKALWLAGKAWPAGGLFFNNRNDILAAQIIFDSDIDLTLMPACGTADKLKLYRRDKKHVKGKGDIGDYLWKIYMRRLGIPKAIYDVAAVAALKSKRFITLERAPRPALLSNGKYDHTKARGAINVITGINKELIRSDLFEVFNKADDVS